MKSRLLMLFVVALMAIGCVSPEAVKAVQTGISVNKGHMNDGSLPQEAREVAQDNYDLLNKVLFNLDGTPLPEDTAGRTGTPDSSTE